jgi:hypothetical protein
MFDDLLGIIGQSMGMVLAMGMFAFIILLVVVGILALIFMIKGLWRMFGL